MDTSDPRHDQAKRVADFLELHPGATVKAIDAACDTGSVTKVISWMKRNAYGVHASWCQVSCAGGHRLRRVRTYVLLSRPANHPQQSLFE